MSQALVRIALEQRLVDWALQNALPFRAENTGGDKPAQFVRGTLLPGRTISLDLTGRHKKYTGLYQVDLCMPQGVGPGDTAALIASLEAEFPNDTYIVEAGVRVLILEPVSAAPGRNDDTHYVTPCSIPYRADTIT